MIQVLVVMAATFGVMFLLDKGFTKAFRSRRQHQSGRAVKLHKGYGVGSLLLLLLGALTLIQVSREFQWLLLVGGILMLALGAALGVYYLSFGVYYDDSTFLVSAFGRKSQAYRYADIHSQLLYRTAGSLMVELWLADGSHVGLQGAMEGVYPFLDMASRTRLTQLGLKPEDCPWLDPDQSLWFPTREA